MQEINSKIKPFISDLRRTNIGDYLASSEFERLAIVKRIDVLWDKVFREAQRNKVCISTDDKKSSDALEALILLLNSGFRANPYELNEIICIIFSGYIDWMNRPVKMDDIFADLEILDFPSDWLREMRKKYEIKITALNAQQKQQLKVQEKKKQLQIDFLTILSNKRDNWINKIATAKTEEAINDMRDFALKTNHDDLIEEMVNQSQRWFRLQRKIRDGIIGADKEQMECSKINKALLQIINSLQGRLKKELR